MSNTVNTREIAEQYRLRHWAKIMQERTENGLSIKAFCQQKGIGPNTYFYWQRKLREAASPALPQPAPVEQSLVPRGWAVCKAAEPVPVKALSIEIGGVRIEVEPDTDQELLVKTCRVLKSLC